MTTAAVLNILVNAQTGTASANLRRFDGQLRATEATANRSTGAMGKTAKAMKTVGVVGGAIAAYGLFKAASAGADFEKQMDSLGSVAGASAKQMKALEKQALALGEATQFTANEVAKAQTELAKGGLSVQKILGGGLKSALSLAAAGELELAQAAETTVNSMKLFGLQGKDSMKIADALATAANKTTADVSDFSMALKQGGSVAKIAGLNFTQTVTILEALAEAGIKNSDAGTSMKTSLIQLLKPSEKQKKLTEELGIEWLKQNGTIKTAVGLSKEVRSATDGMTKAERARTLAVLAGTDGFRTLAALYDASPAKLKMLEQANLKVGTAQKVAAEKTDNLRGDVEELGGALETKVIKGFEKLAPAMRAATQATTEFIRNLGSMNLEEIARKLGIGSEEFKKFKEAAKEAADIFNKYVRPVIQTALEVIVRLLKDFGKVVRGVVRAIVGILTLDFGQFWKGVKEIFSAGIDGALALIKGITKPARTIIAAVGKGLADAFSNVWDGIKGIFSDGVGAIAGFIQSIADIINPLLDAVGVGEIHITGGSNIEGEGRKGKKGHKQEHRQRGGLMFGGAPSGDSIPALLERGEYVVNRKAVKRIGQKQLDALNFGAAPRFQKGGPVEMSIGGDVWGAIGDVAGYTPAGLAFKGAKAAINTASDLAKGADYFINGLPGMGGNSLFSDIGNALVGKVKDWITGLPGSIFGGGSGAINAGALQSFNHTYPKHGLSETTGKAHFSEALTARIASWAGLPGKLFGQIAHGESGFYPGIYGVDPGGASTGYGLWAITSPFNDSRVAKYGGYEQMLNPLKNAKVAKEIYDAAGGISPWYGTKYVTSQRGGLMGMAYGGMAGNPFNAQLMRGTVTSPPKYLASEGFLPKTIGRIKNKAAAIAAAFEGYVYGGGHGEGTHVRSNKLDCSSSLAKLIQLSGWPDFPVGVSGEYESIFQPGAGDPFTIWSNSGHTFAEIEGKMWGTNTSNGLGYHSHTTAGFVPRHPILSGAEGGGSGLSSGQEKQMEGAHLKKAREQKAKELRGLVGKSKTMPGRRTALWDLINYFGQFGIFKDDKLKNNVLEKVRKASSFANPLKSIPSLNKLAGFLEDHVTLSGRGEGNFPDLADEIASARERGQSVGAKRRRGIFKKIIAKGSFSPEQAAQFANFSKSIETLEEQLGVKEGWASAANGPSGSDWDDTETSGVISLNEGLLANLTGKRGFDQDLLAQFSSRQAALTEAIKAARPKGSKSHWKLGAMLKERDGIRATIETLKGDLLDLQGITGEGGRINDVRLALANLGVSGSGSGSEDTSGRLAYIEELLRQANQRNLVFERQKPISDRYITQNGFAGMFAKGGFIPTGQWGIAGEAGPEIVQGPAQVYSNSESAAMGGVGRIVIEDNRVRVYDRSDREIEDVVLKMGRNQGRGAKTVGSKVAGR